MRFACYSEMFFVRGEREKEKGSKYFNGHCVVLMLPSFYSLSREENNYP